MSRILIVDDEENIRLVLNQALSGRYEIDEAPDGETAIQMLRLAAYDLVLTDLRMLKVGGLDVLKEAKGLYPECPVMILTAYSSVDSAVEAMKLGADDYLAKPFTLDAVEEKVKRLLDNAKVKAERDSYRNHAQDENPLIGSSGVFLKLKELIQQAGPSDGAVLIEGETGSGKEGVARALHAASSRAKNAFVAVNCASFSQGLIESEIFGHEKGSFTGALGLKKGRLELADGGTFFLDEVGDLPLDTQVKLLRAIEQKTFERVGGTISLKSDFRVLGATHRNLKDRVAKGAFREDLYFRLAVLSLRVPALRDRGEDILRLAEYFIEKKSQGRGMKLPDWSRDLLISYEWPGNVRELQNVIERAMMLSQGDILRIDLALAEQPQDSAPPRGKTLVALLEDTEKRLLAEAMRRAEGNQSSAARDLGIERTTLQYKLKKYGLH